MQSKLIRAATSRQRSRSAKLLRASQWIAEALEARRLLAGSMQWDGVAYLPNAGGDRLERYDVTNERWLGVVTLAGSPGGLSVAHVDADGIYAAYGRSVFRYRLDGSAATHLIDASFPVQQLHTDGNLLLIDHSLSGRGEFISVNKATNAVVDAQSIAVDGIYGSSISPAANKIFGRTSRFNGSEISYVAYDDTGHFVDSGLSPYRDVDLAGAKTWIFPSESKLVDDSGAVYSTGDLTRFRSLDTRVDDIAFVGDTVPVVLFGGSLRAFASSTLLPIGSATLARPATRLAANDRDVIAFAADAASPTGYVAQVVPLTAIQGPQPGAPVDSVGLVYKPDDVELTRDGTLLLLSAANRSIFRFDPESLGYLPTVALRGVPKSMAYSAENASVYVAYESGLINRVDLTAATPTEQPFVVLPTAPIAIATAGTFLFASFSPPNYWNVAYTFGPDGTLLSKMGRYHYTNEFVWSEANSRLYHVANELGYDALRYNPIGPDGVIGTPSEERNNVAGSERPVRVSPDGKVAIVGSGVAYDAVTLQRLTARLANGVSDIAWIGDDVYTIRTLGGSTQFQRWTGPSFAPAETATAAGTPIALRALGDGRLVGAFHSTSRGVPVFRVMNAQLQTIAESTLPPLPSLDAASIGVNAGSVSEGTGTLRLTAFATGLAADQSIAKWEYDFDYDGVTFTADVVGTGTSASKSYSVDDGPLTRTVAVRVTDNYGQVTIRTRAVTFANAAPRATFSAITVGAADPQRVNASFSAIIDAPGDVSAGMRYSFDFNNDGDFDDGGDVSESASPSASFRFATPGTYTVRGRVADKDGGVTDYVRTLTVSDGANLAAGKPTTASESVVGYPATNATDGDPATEWLAPASDVHSLQVDLGAFYRITSIDVAFNGGAPASFQMQTSVNGAAWASVQSVSGNTASTASVAGPTTTARFVRIFFTRRNGTVSYRVGDLRVIGVPGVAPAPSNVGWDAITTLAEGSTASLQGRTSPLAVGQSIAKWEWDLDYDGTTFGIDATGQTIAIALPDSSVSRTVAVRVTDNFGQVAIGTRTLKPTNVAPTATFTVVPAGPGRATATFINAADPSAADVAAGLRYSFDFNDDGNYSGPGESYNGTVPTATGTFAEPGTYTVAGYVYDRDGAFTKYVATVTVATPPPPTKFGFHDGSFYEGQVFELYGYVEEMPHGQAVTKWEYDFDYDGHAFDVDGSDISEDFDARQIDGLSWRTIGIRITDRFGQTATVAQQLMIRNALPIASLRTSVAALGDGRSSGTITFLNPTDAVAADRGAGFRYSFDFNGDGDFVDDGEVANSPDAVRSHIYSRPGTYTVIGRITDKDGGAANLRSEMVIPGPPTPAPTITADKVYEGQQAALTGGISNVTAATIVSWEWDLDYADGTFTADSIGQNATFDAAGLDGPTSRVAALRATDNFGRVALATRTIHVLNAAPTAGFTFVSNATGTATATFVDASDAGVADAAAGLRYSFDFNNDGDFTDAGDVLNSTSSTATFSPSTSGTVTVKARVTDKDGGPLSFTRSVAVTVPVPIAPPSLQIAAGTSQRSMIRGLILRFDGPVTLAVGTVTLRRDGADEDVALSVVRDADGKTFRLSFEGAELIAGSLADGLYRLTIKRAGVTAAGGTPMTGDANFVFHRLFGDLTGDGTVAVGELGALATAYGSERGSSAYDELLDANDDGRIDVADLGAFASNYGRVIV